ncbi:hypothetical protein BLNAU_21893 [Blattamonas nauphoetae]|uniref:Uncharacterized protein n=1 Tax=Blattamonas nauphoetae TaxID=2049346 RepID=A0ABQ9WV58_9EUKA|nr:hypothetical protein BLNAU_21893 [Blattamonas nauphoetae]
MSKEKGNDVDIEVGLRSHIDNEQHSKSTDKKNEEWKEDSFSLTRRCEFALARIEKAVLMLEKRVGGKMDCDSKTRTMQEKIGGMIVRHFRSSIQSSEKEIGSIGIDLAAVRREMEETMRKMEMREKEREMAAKEAEEERQREFARKMREMESEREKEKREMEEMKRMNEKWIEEGRQREEEKKREEEEEERQRNVKEGAAAIEVFQREKLTLTRNVFTPKQSQTFNHLLSHSFGAVVVRITFIIRAINASLMFGLISTNLTEQAKTTQEWFMAMKGGGGWNCHSTVRNSRQNGTSSHVGSACKAGGVGQRVVMEADGREGKRTLKVSQDGETQPVFFSSIPVPFRFVILPYATGNSVEIVSSEVLREPSMVGRSVEVVMD